VNRKCSLSGGCKKHRVGVRANAVREHFQRIHFRPRLIRNRIGWPFAQKTKKSQKGSAAARRSRHHPVGQRYHSALRHQCQPCTGAVAANPTAFTQATHWGRFPALLRCCSVKRRAVGGGAVAERNPSPSTGGRGRHGRVPRNLLGHRLTARQPKKPATTRYHQRLAIAHPPGVGLDQKYCREAPSTHRPPGREGGGEKEKRGKNTAQPGPADSDRALLVCRAPRDGSLRHCGEATSPERSRRIGRGWSKNI